MDNTMILMDYSMISKTDNTALVLKEACFSGMWVACAGRGDV
jgi:hypothetical protein